VVIDRSDAGARTRLENTAYFTNGTIVWHRPAGRRRARRRARIGGVPATEQPIVLHEGDRLILTRDQRPGRLPLLDGDGSAITPARIPCTPPEVLRDVRAGEPIWFDEGRIGGRILSVDEEQAVVTITTAAPDGTKLGPFKGINLPESDLRLPSLTAYDIETLPFIAEHADLVGYSFVRTTGDLEDLYRRLTELPGRHPAVILKIETLEAFQNLPAILFDALSRPAVGVMIARGDLAVECGFERLAEVQEEILWLCEAAHLPVIWATQVLEGLAKRGLASRAEITDAAFGERAECVMLNKGPFVVETVRSLDEILQRMQEHQEKKVSLLRHLRVVDDFLDALAERAGGGEVPTSPASPGTGSARPPPRGPAPPPAPPA
jgi:pyruvate kinase